MAEPTANGGKKALVTGDSGFSDRRVFAGRACFGPDRKTGYLTRFASTLLLIGCMVFAVSPAEASVRGAAQHLKRVKSSPSKLRNFLRSMPKGTDLHTHLSGAVYAESMIRWGAEDGKCVDTTTMVSSYPPCLAGQVPIANALTDTELFDRIVAAWSMRNFMPGAVSGHDHFFATFDLFGGAFSGRQGDGLAEVTRRAGAQNEQYVEPLITPQFGHTIGVASSVSYNPDFGEMREQLIDAGLLDAIPAAGQQISDAVVRQRSLLNCDTDSPKVGCGVKVGFDVQVLRNQQPTVVFAQLLFGFELMKDNPDWVGMNMVQPEDASLAITYYRLQMKMIRYLKTLYANGNVTLHAGELVPGLTPPRNLRFHIREAVNIAGAQRIGHGADLKWEKDPAGILRSMKHRRTCIEINLTSNRQTLGLTGRRHPFTEYVKAGVRTTLSTDDEGVERTDLTSQYGQAVRHYGFGYRRLKKFARAGLSCSFLPNAEKKAALKDQVRRFRKFESNWPSK